MSIIYTCSVPYLFILQTIQSVEIVVTIVITRPKLVKTTYYLLKCNVSPLDLLAVILEPKLTTFMQSIISDSNPTITKIIQICCFFKRTKLEM